MNERTAMNSVVEQCRVELGEYLQQHFPDFERIWAEDLRMYYFIRKGKEQNTGFSIGITHERRRFRTTILVFKTQHTIPEDILYASPTDSTTIQTDLVFLLMRIYDLSGPEAKAKAFFTWTKRDSFSRVLARIHAVLTQYALPWLDDKVPGTL